MNIANKREELRKSVENNINNQLGVVLEKGGEGSRGGKVIGHTKSGKPVYVNYLHFSHEKFTLEDHEDAHNLHRSKIKNNENSDDQKQDTRHHEEGQKHLKHSERLKTKKEFSGEKSIGKTQSGKEIYEQSKYSHSKTYSSSDHKEAYILHATKEKEYDKAGNDKMRGHHKAEAIYHKDQAKDKKESENNDIEKAIENNDMENLMIHKERVKRNIYDNTLNKGVVSEFGYGNEIKYPKTGSEMKEALSKCLVDKGGKLQSIASRLESIKGYLGFEPNENTPDYFFSDNHEEVYKMCPFIGKIFVDIMCRLDSDQDSTLVPRGFAATKVGYADNQMTADNCREYNQLIRTCCELCKEIAYTKTLYDNVQETDTYYLTLSQLRAINL